LFFFKKKRKSKRKWIYREKNPQTMN
jgi:hypothetical protein